MANFNWTCPYCNRDTTIVASNQESNSFDLVISNSLGEVRLTNYFIVCPNEKCKEATIIAELSKIEYNSQFARWMKKDTIQRWKLKPDSFAKQFPSYVPKALIVDYEESCKIRDLSPKASATLARRCIQGMIRDFWGVQKNRLIDEINAIEDKVDPIIWKSIDSVRKIGNIGAHMEKDIDLIIDVDPNEAQILIEMIEMLIEEWYIHRHERELKLKSIISLSDKKDEIKKTNNAT